MHLHLLKLVFCFIIIITPCFLTAETRDQGIFEESAYWPYRLTLTTPFEGGDEIISKGQSGILIRLEQGQDDETIAVCDFGRYGISRVPLRLTDIAASYDEIASGSIRKQYPNYIAMLGGKLSGTKGSEITRLKMPDLEGKKRLFFLYTDGIESSEALMHALRKQGGIEHNQEALFVYIQLKGRTLDETLIQLSASTSVDAATFPPFLLAAIATTLQHVKPGTLESRLVVTDMNGKVIHNVLGVDAIIECFRSQISEN